MHAANVWRRNVRRIRASLNDKGDTLTYSTYLGGAGNDFSKRHRGSNNGNVMSRFYTGGFPLSERFPTRNWRRRERCLRDQINRGGIAVVSTYLGGLGTDSGQGIAIDSNGSAYVTGSTSGSSPALQPRPGCLRRPGNLRIAFISQFSANGRPGVFPLI